MNSAQYPHCPCCGQAIPDLPRLDSLVVALKLTGDQKRLFTILSAGRGRYMQMRELTDFMYWDHEDGGPADAVNRVSQILIRLRTKLHSYPVVIEEKPITGRPVRLIGKKRVFRRTGEL